MASKRLSFNDISPESKEVFELIENGQNFLLSGGAGSGKTYSLVEIIAEVISIYPLKKVACITYTNAAVEEIEDRIDHPNLYVSTIHEFLWKNIKSFQSELKETLVELINDEDYPRFKLPDEELACASMFACLERGIQYKEYVRLKDGVISHDEVIALASRMYEKYSKLCLITSNSFPCIFVDEYQDTDKRVVEIFLKHLRKQEAGNVIGFFGDAMQSIYEGSIGNLDDYKGEAGEVIEVKKEQNRRNPASVIQLANKIRTDGLEQSPSGDPNAPNMDENGVVKRGSVRFLYSRSDQLQVARAFLGWDFDNSEQTKELNLTHNLISGKAGFDSLMRIYDGDKILDYVRRVKKYIKEHAHDYETKGKTFESVIDELASSAQGKQLPKVQPTDGMSKYISNHQGVYEIALNLKFDEISSIYIDKDQLLDDKKNDVGDDNKAGSNRDDLIKHLFKIQGTVRLYKENRVNEFIKATDYRIYSVDSKKKLKANIDALVNVGERTIGEIIELSDELGLVVIDDRLQRFIDNKYYVHLQVAEVPFSEFQNLYHYLEGFTPFSTQHKTKGSEFDNVLLVLDSGNWTSYNFEYLMAPSLYSELTTAKKKTFPKILDRTQKLFYVCCTRSKENLAVYFQDPSDEVIATAKNLFGEDNVIECSEAEFSKDSVELKEETTAGGLKYHLMKVRERFQYLAFDPAGRDGAGSIYYGYISDTEEQAFESTKKVVDMLKQS